MINLYEGVYTPGYNESKTFRSLLSRLNKKYNNLLVDWSRHFRINPKKYHL
jgi:hypothetical protein